MELTGVEVSKGLKTGVPLCKRNRTYVEVQTEWKKAALPGARAAPPSTSPRRPVGLIPPSHSTQQKLRGALSQQL